MSKKTKIILLVIGLMAVWIVVQNNGDNPIEAPSRPDGNLWE